MSDWPFAQPRNLAVVSVREVMSGEKPILFVCHDADGGDWQFLTGEAVEMKDALLVALHSVVELDESVAELADLPEGWSASRVGPHAAWTRRPA